jgi:AAA15 family ATPase/GTPase
MKLTHLGISYYRSIGKEPVMLDLTKKLNVLVGANNCGKSNVLRALEHFNGSQKTSNYTDADYYHLNKSQEPTFRFSQRCPDFFISSNASEA